MNEFGEQDEVGALARGLSRARRTLSRVAGDIADGRVELRERDGEPVAGAAVHGPDLARKAQARNRRRAEKQAAAASRMAKPLVENSSRSLRANARQSERRRRSLLRRHIHALVRILAFHHAARHARHVPAARAHRHALRLLFGLFAEGVVLLLGSAAHHSAALAGQGLGLLAHAAAHCGSRGQAGNQCECGEQRRARMGNPPVWHRA